MWKAVRSGDPGGYAYLAWMHHNGHIGGHLAPHLQPRLPDGGAESDDRAANKQPGWDPSPRGEEKLKALAVAYWGEERIQRTNAGRGVAATDEMEQGGGGFGGVGRDGGSGGRRIKGGGGDSDDDDDDDDDAYYGAHGGGADGAAGGEFGGRPLRTGEDAWGGRPSEESWPWETIGGGVSGAIAAAD
ncbi:unnamed protein product, partial [Hapterophycus canaliculatus]